MPVSLYCRNTRFPKQSTRANLSVMPWFKCDKAIPVGKLHLWPMMVLSLKLIIVLVGACLLGVLTYDWAVSEPTTASLVVSSASSSSSRILADFVDVVIVSVPANVSPQRYNASLANCERLRKTMRSCTVHTVDFTTPPKFSSDVAAIALRVMKHYEVNLLYNEIQAMRSYITASSSSGNSAADDLRSLLLLEDDAVLKDTFDEDLAAVLNSVRQVPKFVVNMYTTKCEASIWDQVLYSRRFTTVKSNIEQCDKSQFGNDSEHQCALVHRERVIRQFRAWGSWFHSWSYTVGVLYSRNAVQAILSTGTPFEPMDIWLGYLSSQGVFQGHYACPPLVAHGSWAWNKTKDAVTVRPR